MFLAIITEIINKTASLLSQAPLGLLITKESFDHSSSTDLFGVWELGCRVNCSAAHTIQLF
jgi:hypothetical protein